MTYVQVHIVNAPYHIDKPYTYHLPTQLEKKVKTGSVVVVPFGGANKQKLAVVTSVCDKTDCKTTKPVLGVPGKYMFIDGEMLELCKFMKEHLYCSLGDAAACVLPSGLGVKSVRMYSRTDKSASSFELNHASLSVLSALESCEEMSETQKQNVIDVYNFLYKY